jgi:hypothetical protein
LTIFTRLPRRRLLANPEADRAFFAPLVAKW